MKNMSQEYKKNLFEKRLKTLTEMYYNPRINKKRVLQSLIETTKKYQEEENNESIEDRLNYYQYLDSNNNNLNFSVDKLFQILEKSLLLTTDTKFSRHTIIEEHDNKIIKTDILTDIPGLCGGFNLTDNNIYYNIITNLGEKEIFIRTSDSENFKFKELADLVKPTKTLNSELDNPIYYYGGENAEKVNSVLNNVIDCATKYGVSFSKYNYQKTISKKI